MAGAGLALRYNTVYWTQGDNIEELEQMLASLYGDIMQFDDIHPAVPERIGSIAVPA